MLSEKQKAKIQQKEDATPDALKRDPLTNYREGWFFITLNTRDNIPVLSTIEGVLGASGTDSPHCKYTILGEKVKEVWKRSSTVYADVEALECEAMPEHFHGLIHLKPGNNRHLGRIIWGFMAGCTHAYWDTLGIDWLSMTYEKGARAPEWQDRDHTLSKRGPALFVRGYNDVEALTPEQVKTKIEYIRTQAERRLMKGSQHECFRIHRQQHTHSWTLQVAMQAIAQDRFYASEPDKCQQAQRLAMQRLNIVNFLQRPLSSIQPTERLGLDWIGNPEWMASERKLPLVCHRRDAWQFDRQKQAVIDKAREGWVIVSAFISPKEREIKEQLMREQLPFVEIMDNGFAERYKPTGKAFYACAENRLVQITPWTYLYDRDTQVSREQCLVMNQLARVITVKDDDWWK